MGRKAFLQVRKKRITIFKDGLSLFDGGFSTTATAHTCVFRNGYEKNISTDATSSHDGFLQINSNVRFDFLSYCLAASALLL